MRSENRAGREQVRRDQLKQYFSDSGQRGWLPGVGRWHVEEEQWSELRVILSMSLSLFCLLVQFVR